jgi:hypothetical protein
VVWLAIVLAQIIILMTLISVFVSPLIEISSRDLWREVGSARIDEGYIDCRERRVSWQSEGGLLSLSCRLFLLCMGDRALLWLQSCCIHHLILFSNNFIECSGWRRHWASSMWILPRYGSMIDVNQEVHLVGIEWCGSIIWDNQTGIWNKKGRLMFIMSERSNKLRVRIRLIVAIGLQTQQPSFRLHTLSNTPSVPTNDAQESFC